MRIEISSGGIGNGASVINFQADLRSFISNSDEMISSFKAVKNNTYNLSGGVGNLQGALDNVQSRISAEETSKANAIEVQSKANGFLDLANRVDAQVSANVNHNKEELYNVCPWLKPVTNSPDERAWYEKAWDWVCGTGKAIGEGISKAWEWTKDTVSKGWNALVNFYNEHKKIIDTILIVAGAVLAIVAVVATGGLAGAALVPFLTTVCGFSATAAAITSAAVAITAVASTVASSALNIIDVWCEIDNPTFNGWQKGLNITSAVSNLLYSVGGIYNSIKGYKLFSRVDWSGYPQDAPKPKGFYRVLNGDEYDAARKVANTVNRNLHKTTPGLSGLQIHEIHPVKFGGSPSDILNKLFLTPEKHAEFTTFWNNLMRGL